MERLNGHPQVIVSHFFFRKGRIVVLGCSIRHLNIQDHLLLVSIL